MKSTVIHYDEVKAQSEDIETLFQLVQEEGEDPELMSECEDQLQLFEKAVNELAPKYKENA